MKKMKKIGKITHSFSPSFLLHCARLQRLQSKIIKLVDVSYGGENGFNQAIELAAESLQNVKFIQEKKLIGRYFDEISQVCLQIEYC